MDGTEEGCENVQGVAGGNPGDGDLRDTGQVGMGH